MNKEEYRFAFEVYDSLDELNQQDAWLLNEAREVTASAYAPYSNRLIEQYQNAKFTLIYDILSEEFPTEAFAWDSREEP